MRRSIFLLLLLGLALRIYYLWNLPPFRAPDEQAHFYYINYLTNKQRLPQTNPYTQYQDCSWEAHQPPLYYLLLSPFYFVLRQFNLSPEEAILLLRQSSVFLWLLGFFLQYHLLARFWRLPKTAVEIGLLLFTFLPGYINSSSTVNNDNLVIFLATIFLFLLSRFQQKGRLKVKIIYLILLLLAYSKLNALVFLFLWSSYSLLNRNLFNRLQWRQQLQGLIMVLFLLSPWLGRNIYLYHHPLALPSLQRPTEWPTPTLALFLLPIHFLATFWGSAGENYQFFFLPGMSGIIILLSITIIFFRWRKGFFASPKEKYFWFSSSLAFLILFLSVLYNGWRYGQAWGRFFYPFLPWISLFLAQTSSLLSPRRLLLLRNFLFISSFLLALIFVLDASFFLRQTWFLLEMC